jgi:PAS domain S-box-containing protein
MTDSGITRNSPAQPEVMDIRPLQLLAMVVGFGVGTIALVGWVFELTAFTTLGLDVDDPVKLSTAIGFILSSILLVAWMFERYGSAAALVTRKILSCSILSLGIGSILIRFIHFPEFESRIDLSPFRMSVNTAIALCAIGAAWVVDDRRRSSSEISVSIVWTSQVLSLVAIVIGYVAIIGHAYSAGLLYAFSRDVNMALPSAAAAFLLGSASFFRFERSGPAAEVLSQAIGGTLIRRVVLLAALVIPIIGAIRLLAQDRALVDTRLGAALFAASNVLLLAIGMWISGRRLNQIAASERFVRNALSDQASLLETRVRERTIELETSETRFRMLADAAPVLIFLADVNLRVESINAMAASFLGDTSRAVSDNWRLAVHPDDIAALEQESQISALAKSAFSLQIRLRRHDGEYRWMEARGVPRLDQRNRVTGFIGICLDVTDEYLAREQLSRALDSVEQALGRERILRREIDHRVRNNIASLLGLTSFYESSVLGDTKALAVTAAIRGKIRAMKEVHDLVVRTAGGVVDIRNLWERLLGAMVADDLRNRIRLTMPALPPVKPNQASALAMVLQELLANSSKHGALSPSGGSLLVEWTIQGVDCSMSWTDQSASLSKPALEADDSGLGLELIRGLVESDLRGSCEFRKQPGVWTCNIQMKFE